MNKTTNAQDTLFKRNKASFVMTKRSRLSHHSAVTFAETTYTPVYSHLLSDPHFSSHNLTSNGKDYAQSDHHPSGPPHSSTYSLPLRVVGRRGEKNGLIPKAAALPGAQRAHQGPWAPVRHSRQGQKETLLLGKWKDLWESKPAFLPI